MKLKDIMLWSDGFTDEVQTAQLAVGYANKAIAAINTNFNTRLPFITDVNTDYTALEANWFVRFMMSSLSYGIKMNDGSLTEAMEYKSDFEVAMYEFEGADKSSVIPDEQYRGDGVLVQQIDTSYAIDAGWFGNTGTTWNGW
jgi:hypothetical protein